MEEMIEVGGTVEPAPANEKNGLHLDSTDKANLEKAAKWAKFVAVVEFIVLALTAMSLIFMLLATVVAGVALFPEMGPLTTAFVTIYMSVMMLVVVVSFLMAFYTFRFARKALVAVEADDRRAMSESLVNLRRMFCLQGVMMIVYIAIVGLMLIVAVIAGVGSALFQM